MKPVPKSVDRSKTPEGISEELLKLHPETFRGYNILAGMSLWLAIHKQRIMKGTKK